MQSRSLLLFFGLLLAMFAGGCRTAVVPLPVRSQLFEAGGRADTLVVFLPGRGGSMNDFERQGLEAILRESGARVDVTAVDAHLGYYINRTVVDRLWVDVLQPARAQGYRRIVLVGLSLGGVGALFCERDHPGSVDAVVLMSPYLGDKKRFFDAIDAAGGPAAWAQGRARDAGGVEEQIWTFLGQRSAQLPPTWLLYGTKDGLSDGHRRLAALLPAGRVVVAGGGHDWPTWRELWRKVCVDTDLFGAEKAGGGGSARNR